MKILEICMSQGFGGLELYVLKTSLYLHENNKDYFVLTRRNSFLYEKLSGKDVEVKSFSRVFHFLPFFSAYKLARFIDLNEIDVVHIHWGDDLFLTVLAKVLCHRKIKLIYTRQMALTRDKKDIYHRFLYRNIDLYLVITKKLYSEAGQYLPLDKHKIKVLYYGVPEALRDTGGCEKYISESGMDNAKFKLAIFGRIEPGKGQHLVVNAVKKLKLQGYPVQLAMIGHVMDQDYFKQMMASIDNDDLADSVFYLGFHNQPTSIMSCFRVVILASKCETFGLVLPEAMRAGVAVVGSDCGGVPEIIQHEKTGLLFESENEDDLTLQLEKLVSDQSLCQRLAIAGKEDADERFSEEKHFAKLLEYFETT